MIMINKRWFSLLLSQIVVIFIITIATTPLLLLPLVVHFYYSHYCVIILPTVTVYPHSQGMVQQLMSGPCIALEVTSGRHGDLTPTKFRELVGPSDPVSYSKCFYFFTVNIHKFQVYIFMDLWDFWGFILLFILLLLVHSLSEYYYCPTNYNH